MIARSLLFFLGIILFTESRIVIDKQQQHYRYSVKPRDFMTDKILSIMEKVRQEMKNGFPEADIPPLDPLVLPDLDLAPITLAHLGKLDIADFNGIKIEGLQNFQVDGIKTSIIMMEGTLNISLAELKINGNYKVNGKFLGVLPVFGDGGFACAIKGSRIITKARLTSQDGSFLIDKLSLNATIGELTLHLDGLMGGGDLGEQLNHLLEKVANRLIHNLAPTMVDELKEYFRLKINAIIKNLDIM